MSGDFVAFDIETANATRGSVCSIGVAVVDGGSVKTTDSWLVQPPPGIDHFDGYNSGIHGITAADVADAASFSEGLDRLVDVVGDRPLLAHYASFDIGNIREGCSHLGRAWPSFDYGCSWVLSKRALQMISYRLPLVCEELGVELGDHHNAEEDARACADVILRLMSKHDAVNINELFDELDVRWGRLQPGSSDGCVSRASRGGSSSLVLPDVDALADPDHPLCGQVVCFTGALSVPRQQMWDNIASYGARPDKSVTKKTTMLVIGGGFVGESAAEFSTGKAKKAVEYLAKGQSIEVLNEADFMQLLEPVHFVQ